MDSRIMFLGIVKDSADTIGVKLIDIDKKESSMVTLDSFKKGLSKGVRVLNTVIQRGEIGVYGGMSSYSIYDKDGTIRKKGLPLLYKLSTDSRDKDRYAVILPKGEVVNSMEWVKNNNLEKEYLNILIGEYRGVLSIPNIIDKEADGGGVSESNVQERLNTLNKAPNILNDIEILRRKVQERLGIDYGDEMFKHIDTKLGIRGQFNANITRLNKYRDKARNIIGATVGCNDETERHKCEIVLTSKQPINGVETEFNGFFYEELFVETRFKLKDILYVRDVNRWYGNKEILDNSVKYEFLDINEDGMNIELILYSHIDNTLYVITSSRSYIVGDFRIAIRMCRYDLDMGGYFPKKLDILATLIDHNIYMPKDRVGKHPVLDVLAEFNSNRDINDTLGDELKISDIDKKDSELYSLNGQTRKEKISILEADYDKLNILYNKLEDAKIISLYKHEGYNSSLLYVKRNCPADGKSRYTHDFNKVYTGLEPDRLKKILSKMKVNRVYKNLGLAVLDANIILESTPYTMVYSGSSIFINTNRGAGEVKLNTDKSEINRIINDYECVAGSNSVACLLYRTVLKYDKNINRCKEQLMYNGEIEDFLDEIILEDIIDEANDRVTVYIGRYKLEMSLSLAKKQLSEIYHHYNKDVKTQNTRRKLDVMGVAGNVSSINNNIILTEKLSNTVLKVPSGVKSIIIQGDNNIMLNKLILTENLNLASNRANLLVGELELSNKASKIVQRNYKKLNASIKWMKCKVDKVAMSGAETYEFILAMFSEGGRIPLHGSPKFGRSKEACLVSKIDDLSDIIKKTHQMYDVVFLDKSIIKLINYLKALNESNELCRIMRTNDIEVAINYIRMMKEMLESYNVSDVYCKKIRDLVYEIVI